MDAKVEMILRRYQNSKDAKTNFESLYRDTAYWLLTRKENIGMEATQGGRKTDHIFDTTGVLSSQRLSSGMFSYLCPPNEDWFALRSSHYQLNQQVEVQNYFSQVSSILRQNLYISNFVLELYEAFLDLVVFGTTNVRVEEGTNSAFNFKTIFIDEYSFCENASGEVDTVFREFEMSARNMVTKFGLENCSEEIRKCVLDQNRGSGQGKDKKFKIIHAVMPRRDYDPSKIDYMNMKYMSTYVDLEHKCILQEGGFIEMPYMVARFTKASNELYGRGCGTEMLPTVKLANAMMKTILMAGEKAVDPPMIMPDDGSLEPFDTSAGALNYWRATSFNNKPEPLKLQPNIPIGLEMIQKVQEDIKEGFYNDVILALQDRQNMTATEVMQRVGEKLVMMLPIIGRVQTELLTPMINRCYRILAENKEIPPPPPVLQAYPSYEVVYLSKLAMAVKLLDVDATQDTLNAVAPLIQLSPEAMDVFNVDNIVRGTAYREGMPPEFLNSPDVVAQTREDRAKQMEQQQMMEQLPAMADGVSKMGDSDMGKQLMEGMGQGGE